MESHELLGGNGGKDPNRDDIPSGLLRQRRNLILISFTLLFLYYFGVEIKTAKLTILGAELTLSNPTIFDDFIIIWMAWAYFFWRYVQYLLFYKVSTDIGSEYRQYAEPLYNQFFLQKYLNKFPDEKEFKNPSIYFANIKFGIFKGFRYVRAGYIDEECNIYKEDAQQMNLNFFIASYCSIRAACSVLVTSRHVSDYWLPHFIALSPLAYFLITTS